MWLTIAAVPGDGRRAARAAGLTPLGGTDRRARRVAAERRHARRRPGRRADVGVRRRAAVALHRRPRRRRRGPTSAARRRGARVRPSLGAVDREARRPGVVRRRRRRLLRQRPTSRSSTWQPTRRSSPWLRRLAGAVDESRPVGRHAARRRWRCGRRARRRRDHRRRAVAPSVADRFDVNYPEPSMWVEAVLAVPDGTSVPDDLAAIAADALVGAGVGRPVDGRPSRCRAPRRCSPCERCGRRPREDDAIVGALAAASSLAAACTGRRRRRRCRR